MIQTLYCLHSFSVSQLLALLYLAVHRVCGFAISYFLQFGVMEHADILVLLFFQTAVTLTDMPCKTEENQCTVRLPGQKTNI